MAIIVPNVQKQVDLTKGDYFDTRLMNGKILLRPVRHALYSKIETTAADFQQGTLDPTLTVNSEGVLRLADDVKSVHFIETFRDTTLEPQLTVSNLTIDTGAGRLRTVWIGDWSYTEGTLKFTVPPEATSASVEFDWGLSSHPYDSWYGYFDGVRFGGGSGVGSGHFARGNLSAGEHTIKMTFRTDGSVQAGYHGGWITNLKLDIVVPFTTYKKDGSRITPEIDISSIGLDQLPTVTWKGTFPTGTTTTVESSISEDGGATWGEWMPVVYNGAYIQNITPQTDLSNARLRFKINLHSDDGLNTPLIDEFRVDFYKPDFPPVGYWESPVIDMERYMRDYKTLVTTAILPTGSSYKVYTSTSEDRINFTPFEELGAGNTIVSPRGRYLKIKLELVPVRVIEQKTLRDFTAGEQSQLLPSNDVQVTLDGEMYLKTRYTEQMVKDTSFVGDSPSSAMFRKQINIQSFKKVEKVVVS